MTTADDNRYHARLAQLPQEVLLELCSKIVTENAATRRTAEEVLSQHQPLPAWAIQEVLLSPDLLLHIFPFLEVPDVAAARVCRPWRDAWKATDGDRRWLRLAAPEPLAPDFSLGTSTGMAALPDAMGIYVSSIASNMPARIVDANLQTLRELPDLPVAFMSAYTSCAASHLGLFVSIGEGLSVRRYELDGFTVAAEYLTPLDDDEDSIYTGYDCLTLANDMLFAVGFNDHNQDEDEIICFDARTLTERRKFGQSLFEDGCYGLAVVGDELYAADRHGCCIKVFSFAGVHLRDIAFLEGVSRPERIVHFCGRLYVSEEDPENGGYDHMYDEDDEESQPPDDFNEIGHRIFVLTPEGEVLQKFKLPDQSQTIARLFLSGERLLCTAKTNNPEDNPGSSFDCLALKGI